jgi:hypothetical protein
MMGGSKREVDEPLMIHGMERVEAEILVYDQWMLLGKDGRVCQMPFI